MSIMLSEARPVGHALEAPDPEVPQVAKRRRFTTEYKLQIIAEAEACTQPGEVGALLPREGLYSSHLAEWRKQARQGLVDGLDKKRGRRPGDPLVAENAKLRKENERLEKRLAQAQAVIELQKNYPRSWGSRVRQKTKNQRRDQGARRGRRKGGDHQSVRGTRNNAVVPLPAAASTRSRSRAQTKTVSAKSAVKRRNEERCWRCWTRTASATARPRKSTPSCSTRGDTCAPPARCTASSRKTTRWPSAATRGFTPPHTKPELSATAPNRLWSWDVTKLKGPAKWTSFYLYVILDIFSRYAVGWMVASRETAEFAKRLIKETIAKYGIDPEGLTVHSDRGSAQRAKLTVQLLADLGIVRSHGRPHTPNDNPYSESQFKTLKFRPDFPDRFGSIEDVREFCSGFFNWYNNEHRHSGIGFLTPHDVHFGLADAKIEARQQVLFDAYLRNPERFVKGPPKPSMVPREVWINGPGEGVIAH